MALWLERRDGEGRLTAFPFSSGVIDFPDWDGETSLFGRPISVGEAVQLAKASAHVDLEKRDWTLRISFPKTR